MIFKHSDFPVKIVWFPFGFFAKRDLGDCHIKSESLFLSFLGFEERHSVREDGEAIAMERFDQSEDYGELPSEDTLFDETSLKEWN